MPTIPAFTPTTWVEGTAPGISAAELQRIDDQVDAVSDGFGGVVTLQATAAISIDDDTQTIPGMTTEIHDDWANTGLNPIDIPEAGIYIAMANIRWQGNSGGAFRNVRIETDGASSVVLASVTGPPNGVFTLDMNVGFVGFLDAVDDLRVSVYQDSGVALNVEAGSRSRFSVARLGVHA